MGKKSKRKSNTPSQCYHGCTKKEFNNSGEYYKIVEDYDRRTGTMAEFFISHQRFMRDPIFARFVIAHVTDDYVKGKYDAIILEGRLHLLTTIRYQVIPMHEGKDVGPESEVTKNYHKYNRDIETERGRINCMAREIPCDCMEEKKKEAKLMEKTAVCFECRQEFLKKKMHRCKGCDRVQYCSKECQIEAWPKHKAACKLNGVLSAALKTGSLP